MIGLCFVSEGAEKRFAWESPVVTNGVGISSFNLYGRVNSTNFVNPDNILTNVIAIERFPSNEITHTTGPVTLTPDIWHFAATTVGDNGIESAFSSVISVDLRIPNPPKNLRFVQVTIEDGILHAQYISDIGVVLFERTFDLEKQEWTTIATNYVTKAGTYEFSDVVMNGASYRLRASQSNFT